MEIVASTIASTDPNAMLKLVNDPSAFNILMQSVSSLSSPTCTPQSVPSYDLLLFHSITALTQVAIKHYQKIPPATIISIRDQLYSLATMPGPQSQVCRRCAAGGAAVFWKMGWNNFDPTVTQQLFQSVHMVLSSSDASSSSSSSSSSSVQALTFLTSLVGEFGGTKGTSVGLSLEFHKTARKSFESSSSNGLRSCLLIAVESLKSNANSTTDVKIQPTINLLTEILSWEFGGNFWTLERTLRSNEAAHSLSKTLIKPPQSWSPILIHDPTLLQIIFKIYSNLVENPANCSGAGASLAGSVRQLILQVCSLAGPGLFPNTNSINNNNNNNNNNNDNTRGSFAHNILDGLMPVLSALGTPLRSSFSADFVEAECTDLSTICERLSTNFGLANLALSPHFLSFLSITTGLAVNLFCSVAHSISSVYDGDLEMLVGNDEWKFECFDCLVGGIVGIVDALNDDHANHPQILQIVEPIYGEYLKARCEISRAEENRNARDGTDLDEVREDIAEDELNEQLVSISTIGRVNLYNSLSTLNVMFGSVTGQMHALFQSSNCSVNCTSVTPDAAALLEDARILIMAIGFLLTDENKGETPSIPEIILKINHERPDTVQGVNNLVSLMIQLGQFQASKIATTPNDPHVSPYLAHTLMWFFQRFIPSYVMPDVGLYSNVLVAGNTLFVLFCAENGSALQLIDFVATLCCHYFCYWPLERQVGKGAIELLKALTNNPSMRKSLQFSDSWSQLGMLTFFSLNLRTTSTQQELEATRNEMASAGVSITFEMLLGMKRLPYEFRGDVLSVLCTGGAGSACDGSESGSAENSSAVIKARCLHKLQSMFVELTQQLTLNNSSSTRGNKTMLEDLAMLCVNLYHGVAKSQNDEDFEYTNTNNITSNSTNIPTFVTPALPSLANLMSVFIDNLGIVEGLIKLFRDYAEHHIAFLNSLESVELYKASTSLLRLYCGGYAGSGSGRKIAGYKGEEGDEEDQQYGDVLGAIQLLKFLGTKDFLDMNNDNSGKASVDVTDVIFYGLGQIMPLMTAGLLQYPTLTSEFFILTSFTVENYPEKLGGVGFELTNGLVESMAWGMSASDVVVGRSSLRGLEEIAKEQLKNGSMGVYLSKRGDLFSSILVKLLKEVVLTGVVFDRIDAAGGALGGLIALDLVFFGRLVESVVVEYSGGDAEVAGQLRRGFEGLCGVDVLGKLVERGAVGRAARLRFKALFAEFVKMTSSYLIRK